MIPKLNSKIFGPAIAGTAALSAYLLLIRPWHLRWGATKAEIQQSLPGDELVTQPKLKTTHAITIHASTDQVWPWLAQIGQGRAGFYSYEWLENLIGCDIHNTDRIVPEWQTLKVGDEVRLHPQIPPLPVVAILPGQAIVFYGRINTGVELDPDAEIPAPESYYTSSWVFFLEPVDSHTTRLIVRTRADWTTSILHWFDYRVILEPASFIMERKMLLGIKQRAEAVAV